MKSNSPGIDDRVSFEEEGALRLAGLLSRDEIDLLTSQLTKASGAADRPHQRLFSNAAYDFANDDPAIKTFLQSDKIQLLIRKLCRRSVFFTQSIAFDLYPGDAGFKWHLGYTSFIYIGAQDMGYTLWVPLVPVHPEEQGGGLSYVSRRILDGKARAKLAGALFARDDYKKLVPNLRQVYDEERAILEATKVQWSFDLGDALFFDRFVYHRSETLRQGPLSNRPAFVFRFIDSEARYAKKMLSRQPKGSEGQSRFMKNFALLEDGEPIRNAPFDLLEIG